MKHRTIVAALICTLSLLACVQVNAQEGSIDAKLTKALETDQLLPMLIDSAVKFSPEVRRTMGNEEYAQANLRVSKNAIFNAFNLQSSYIYGTNYTAVSDKTASVAASNLTTAQTGFYNLGVVFQLPVSSLLNRKHIIRSGQSQVAMARAEKDNLELVTKQEVIRLYHEFKLAHKMMGIGNKSKQTSMVNKAMAEKDFTNGQLTIDRLTVVVESYNKSLLEYETYVTRFQSTFMQLEAFTGVDLSALITHVR